MQIYTRAKPGGRSTDIDGDQYSAMIPHKLLALCGWFWVFMQLIMRWSDTWPALTPRGFRKEYLYSAKARTPDVPVSKGTYSKGIRSLKEFCNVTAKKVTHIGREYCGVMLGLCDVAIAKINKHGNWVERYVYINIYIHILVEICLYIFIHKALQTHACIIFTHTSTHKYACALVRVYNKYTSIYTLT
jgi:hypothetical protein